MIIDFHTHIFPDEIALKTIPALEKVSGIKAATDGTLTGLLQSMEQTGVDIGLPQPVHCPPEKMRRVLDKIKPEKMVLAHCGGWKQWEEVYNCLAGENVYLDTAFTFDYMETETFIRLLSKHDNKKILFATDSPWGHPTREIQALKCMGLGQTVLEDILSNNAVRLLGGDVRRY